MGTSPRAPLHFAGGPRTQAWPTDPADLGFYYTLPGPPYTDCRGARDVVPPDLCTGGALGGAPSRGFLEQWASATTQGAAGIFNRIYTPFCTPDGRLAQPYDLMDLARSSGGEQRARAEAFCDAERTLSCDLDFVAVSIRNFAGADPERLLSPDVLGALLRFWFTPTLCL